MEYRIRDNSVLTGKKNLEPLYVFKDFPVFMGCTDQMDQATDIKADMSFAVCRDTGIIQLDKLLPLDLVYQSQHNDGIGKIWQDHYLAFSEFLETFSPKKILEIGGANDFIAKDFLSRNSDARWIVVEPHPLFEENKNIRIIKKWFDASFSLDEKVDTVVHSHVLEHTYAPVEFIEHIARFLNNGERHIFTFPNMTEMLSKKYTNCLNFEHTAFLAEPFVDALLERSGFRILKKEYFQDHSIFYATERVVESNGSTKDLPNRYEEYKKLFTDFIQYHEDLVASLNQKIHDFDGEVYIFGAHIFSQYLLEFGLDQNRIKCILDNSQLKNKKRLYGTGLIVENPEVICGVEKACVILKIGSYRDEVMKQLKELNANVTILE
ncbi:methyltransferase [Candidatus Gracilibacteria bacterium]|nr:methyltransferase [Candidatus Gracilibacteria bacterium]